jgi:hypothetical protein
LREMIEHRAKNSQAVREVDTKAQAAADKAG